MSQLIVRAGDFTFQARFEEQLAPKTCAAFRKANAVREPGHPCALSGEGVWMPLAISISACLTRTTPAIPRPARSSSIPAASSETEIPLGLMAGVHFASKMGQLAGNHFITLTSGLENLAAFGKTVLWKGAQKIRFRGSLGDGVRGPCSLRGNGR